MGTRITTELVIITGMSGAGKTVAIQSFEDLGYYCVDNLPPTLIPKFLELMHTSKNTINRVALVVDLRGRAFFDELFEALSVLEQTDWLSERILFLDARDETLVTRYKETRRTHPLADGGLPLIGIQNERELLVELREKAQIILNTTDFSPRALREKILTMFCTDEGDRFSVHFLSFGFKYGIPIDTDLVFDVRFLPNPHYVPQMQPLTGQDEEVVEYVFKWHDTKVFAEKITDLLQFLIPLYNKEGKSQLVVAIGCTGGQHRSVALVEHFKNIFERHVQTNLTHRDIEKRKFVL